MKQVAISFLTNDIFVSFFVTALVGATGWLTQKIGAWFGAKTAGTKYANVIAQIGHAVETAVLAVEQTLVPKILKAKADGIITDTEKNELFEAADDAVVAMLGSAAGIEKLCKSVRMSRGAFDAMRRNMIESAVHRLTK